MNVLGVFFVWIIAGLLWAIAIIIALGYATYRSYEDTYKFFAWKYLWIFLFKAEFGQFPPHFEEVNKCELMQEIVNKRIAELRNSDDSSELLFMRYNAVMDLALQAGYQIPDYPIQ